MHQSDLTDLHNYSVFFKYMRWLAISCQNQIPCFVTNTAEAEGMKHLGVRGKTLLGCQHAVTGCRQGRPLHSQVEAGCFMEKKLGEVKLRGGIIHLTNRQNTVICTAHKRLEMLP